MRLAKCLLPWLALACLLGAACGAAVAAGEGETAQLSEFQIASSSSSSRSLLQSGSSQPKQATCVCTMQYEPVCGKDGTTYGNSCSAKCQGVEVAYTGECSSSGSSGSTSSSGKPRCSCVKLYAPVCGKDKRTYGNDCEAKCAGVQVESTGACTTATSSKPSSDKPVACGCAPAVKEVCGADGKTYTNECLATCAGTKVVSQGICKAAAAGGSSSSKAKCTLPCPVEYEPVCGANGRTYTSACTAACRGVEVVSPGFCPPSGKTGRKPGCACTALYDPVCGKNGKTYANSCEAKCEGVAVATQGMCQLTPVDPKALPSSGGRKSSCVCPAVWKPICTTSGKTRGNKCEASCRDETVAHEGECENPVTTESNKASTTRVPTKASLSSEQASAFTRADGEVPSVNAASPPMKPPRKPGCVCVALYAPVCGEDGNTYSNKCEAGCHNMKVAREDECPGASSDGDAAEASGSSTPSVKPGCNVCPALFAPVCGADGQTYGNDCEAICRGKTTVAHTGRCKNNGGSTSSGFSSAVDKCISSCGPSDNKPVCGTDGKRYKSSCAARCHFVDVAYPGDCKGECSACPHSWYPYCINSGQYGPSTFANCCYAKCNGVHIVREVLHIGGCVENKCGKCDPNLERPLCCQGRTYKNGCFASCNEEDTSKCSLGRCSSLAHVEKGLACALGPCNVKCDGAAYDNPVCGSDGLTYPNQCSLMCSHTVAIVHQGKCGVCASNQLPGGFPYCTMADRQGVSPVCGKDGVTYRNTIAAKAANIEIAASSSTCSSQKCGSEGEACFHSSSSGQSSCCTGLACTPDSSVLLEAAIATKIAGGAPGVCKRQSATFNA